MFISLLLVIKSALPADPIALSEAGEQGLLKTGDLVLLCAVGGGFTGGAHLLRWSGREVFA